MDRRSYENRARSLPDIFYRYTFKDGKIHKTEIRKNKNVGIYFSSSLFYFQKDDGSRTYLSHVERIEIGKYNGIRQAVFLESDNAEAEAAAIFDMYYNEKIAECEEAVKDYILKRKTLYQIMRGENNG